MFGVVPRLQAYVLGTPLIAGNERVKALLNHPAGPFTIHFWAPLAKWMISLANIADFNRPIEKMSWKQQTAVFFTGLIWSRYSTQITPFNWNLLAVNFTLGLTGLWHLVRIGKHHYEQSAAAAAMPAALPPLPPVGAGAASAAAASAASASPAPPSTSSRVAQ